MGFQFAFAVHSVTTIPDGKNLLRIKIHLKTKNQTNEKFFKTLLSFLICNLCISN